jgi:YHS domain-containing protein
VLCTCSRLRWCSRGAPRRTRGAASTPATSTAFAIEGYDTVAYFTDGKATKGSEEFAYDWLGATWFFANAEHRDLFAENPVQYAPQYGGHCAMGAAFGESTSNIDPDAWAIVNGKLYLQYSKGASEDWEKDSANLIAAADQKWPEIKARLENAPGG